VSWLRKAALGHNAEAAFELGEIYLRPDYPQANSSQAFRWFTEAASAGSSEAAYRLALFHWSGRVGAANPIQAFKWAKRSAQAGNAAASLFLSKLLENGEGTSRNPIAALALVILTGTQASSEEDRHEAELRERELSATLSSSQVRAAGMMAKDASSMASFVAAL